MGHAKVCKLRTCSHLKGHIAKDVAEDSIESDGPLRMHVHVPRRDLGRVDRLLDNGMVGEEREPVRVVDVIAADVVVDAAHVHRVRDAEVVVKPTPRGEVPAKTESSIKLGETFSFWIRDVF